VISGMLMDEQFDADEILRDIDDHLDEDGLTEEEIQELELDNPHQRKKRLRDMAEDIDNTEDNWE
jgi:predicted metal-dependent phosphotriesterase family hydrolase